MTRELWGDRVLDVRAFEERYDELVSALGAGRENEGCVECVGCSACISSTFCRESERLVRCHYCIRCAVCTDSSHCRDCRSLLSCNHCIETESSVRSSYVVRSVALSDCTYCFGCAGISGKDFHILNEPYDRTSYFEITARLARDLRIVR